jgi:tetratricopeptide (TPR) repeat protein
MYYRYSQKWVDLFEKRKVMVTVETGHYIKGMHTLLNAHFDLHNFEKFEITLKQLEQFSKTPAANLHDNFRTHTSIYINNAKLNQFLMQGNFVEGLQVVPAILEKLEEYSLFVDSHRILVFNYKIASLYFGAGEFSKSIDFLHKIINDSTSGLRDDLQCYAKLMHLLCHYELRNDGILDSLIKSVYRFMAKMKNLTVVEEEIFAFLRHSLKATARQLKPELNLFLQRLKHLEKNRFETRSFAYLDIISWIESKVYEKPVGEIIRDKFLQSRHRKKDKIKPDRESARLINSKERTVKTFT